jgi:hypothetical protein
MKQDDAEESRRKREALEQLEVTFVFLTSENFGQYVNYL